METANKKNREKILIIESPDGQNEKKSTKEKNGISFLLFLISFSADIATLVAFATSFLHPDPNSFFMNPGLWLSIQIIVVVIGNVSLGYSFMNLINKKYRGRNDFVAHDIKNSLLFISYCGWLSSYLIWLTTFVLIGSSNVPVAWLVGIFTTFGMWYFGLLLARWSTLLFRTLNPEKEIKISIDAGFRLG